MIQAKMACPMWESIIVVFHSLHTIVFLLFLYSS